MEFNRKTVFKSLAIIGVIIGLWGCASKLGQDIPGFTTSKAQITEAKKEFRKSDHNFLSLLLVDREGNVVKVKRLASKLDDRQQDLKVIKAMYTVKLNRADLHEQNYREFILPYTAGVDASNDPTETTRRAYQPREYIPPSEF